MKTTIDIPDNELSDAIRFTGAKTKRAAVVAALEDFNRRCRMAELTRYSGTFKEMMSNEEIERLEMDRMKSVHGSGYAVPDGSANPGRVAEEGP